MKITIIFIITNSFYSNMQPQKVAMFAIVAIAAATGGFGANGFSSTNDSATYSESGNIIGHVTMTVTDADGNVVDYVQSDNLVVDAGLDSMADLVFPNTMNLNGNATDNVFQYIGIGTGTTAADATDTAEETLISGCSRVLDSSVTGTSGVSGEITATVDASFAGSECAGAITEAVLTNSGTGSSAGAGEILARQVFSPVNVGSSDTLTVSWAVTFT